MNKVIEYLSSPATWIWFIVFVFWLGAVRGTLNGRIELLEKNVSEIDVVSIQSQLSAIQSDLQWIKYQLQK